MRPSSRLLQHSYEEVLGIFLKHGGSDPHIYGSVARRTDTDDSDIDFFATFAAGEPWGGGRYEVEYELERLLDCRIGVQDSKVQHNDRSGHRVRRDMVSLATLYTPEFHNLPPSSPVEWTNGPRAELERLFGWRLVDHLELIVYWCDELADIVEAARQCDVERKEALNTRSMQTVLGHIGYFCHELGRVPLQFARWDRREREAGKRAPGNFVAGWSTWAIWDWRGSSDPNFQLTDDPRQTRLWAMGKAPRLRAYVFGILDDRSSQGSDEAG